MRIKCFGKNVFETFDHYIYELDMDDFSYSDNELEVIEISKNNLENVGNSIGRTTSKWIEESYPYVKGFVFLNEEKNMIGSCWVMFQGGNEKLYRIRKHDSFIFRVQIEKEFQSQGYATKMMNKIIKYLKDSGCKNTCLACATKNVKANGLYEKMCMRRVSRLFFIRVFDKNLPYHTL